MNSQFQAWFSQGKISEALAGLDEYFVADHTYRNEHDFILALGQLFVWLKNTDNKKEGIDAIESAIEKLFKADQCIAALKLLRSYAVLNKSIGTTLPLNEE